MSSVSVRFFIITDDSEIFKVPINRFERLLKCSDEEKIERFAGKRDHAVWWKPDMQLERNILDASIDEFKCKRLLK